MAVTYTFAIGREQCFQQIDKLIKSHSLHTSESLCKLLRYLAEHSLDHPGIALKEYQIATEVLGRPVGFDPQSDSTVRVQAGRLRIKLAEYYAHEGPDDPLVVEIPKGSYALTFHLRPSKARFPSGSTLTLEPGSKKDAPDTPKAKLGNRRIGSLRAVDRFRGDHCCVAGAHANPDCFVPYTACCLSDFLEPLRGRSPAAMGDFQQRQLCGTSADEHALFQPVHRFA